MRHENQENTKNTKPSTQISFRGFRAFVCFVAVAGPLVVTAPAQRGDQPSPASPNARVMAPIDLTGYWVSVVTEDWRYRMLTPRKGDYASVPLNAAARQVADAWDPAKDEASGDACKAYGVANIMRVPGRVHITWQDDQTLKIESDAGTQTRVLHFPDPAVPGSSQAPGAVPGGSQAPAASWQGFSTARWEIAGPQRRGGSTAATARGGSLKVVTTHMKAGYLRKNGVPYSENALVTEYFDRHTEPNGDQWFTVTTIVDDPKYLAEPFITSSHFKKEANGAKWRATACSAS
jgi:hypothetical protein